MTPEPCDTTALRPHKVEVVNQKTSLSLALRLTATLNFLNLILDWGPIFPKEYLTTTSTQNWDSSLQLKVPSLLLDAPAVVVVPHAPRMVDLPTGRGLEGFYDFHALVCFRDGIASNTFMLQ